MSAKERLQRMQAALVERGVVDVKFCISFNPTETGMTAVTEDVVNFLQAAVIDNKGSPAEKLGDGVRKAH